VEQAPEGGPIQQRGSGCGGTAEVPPISLRDPLHHPHRPAPDLAPLRN